jgi:hypothetical protein
MLVNYVNEKISRVMALIDSDGGGSISKKEFMQIMDNVEAVRCLSDVGVDVFALIDLADYIFEDDDTENTDEIELDFSRLMEVVLQLRGTNQATVKDIVDLRKFMRLSMQENHKLSTYILAKLNEGARISEELRNMMAGSASSGLNPEKMFGSLECRNSSGSADMKTRKGVEDGPAPIWPHATPSGQLLSWVPIAVADWSPPLADEDGTSYQGAWIPMSAEKETRISQENEKLNDALLLSSSNVDPTVRSLPRKQKKEEIGLATETEDSQLQLQPATEMKASTSLRIPRLQFMPSHSDFAFNEPESKAKLRHGSCGTMQVN